MGIILRVAGLAICAPMILQEVPALANSPDAIRGDRPNPASVSVLQNRHFVKAMRPEVGFAAGLLMDEAFTDTTTVGGRIGLFANEWAGFEFQVFENTVEDSTDRKVLNQIVYEDVETGEQVTPDPDDNPIYGATDMSLVIAPFYGKINVFNALIVYSDLHFTIGTSTLDTLQGRKNSVTFGAGQRFYFKESWSLRVDYKSRIFDETRGGEERQRHSKSFDVGISYFAF